MDLIVENVEKVGKVLVQKSGKGEPLLVGFVKLGKKKNYTGWAVLVGVVVISIALHLYMGWI